VIDHHKVGYLNPSVKMHCVYCGYFNGLIAYVQEIGARTEQDSCPIKHARKLKDTHNRYHKLMEQGDGIDYHNNHEAIRCDFAALEGEEQRPSSDSLTACRGHWYSFRRGYPGRCPSSDR